MVEVLDPELPEFLALCELAQVDTAKAAAGFNDATRIFEHISLEELAKLREASGRFADLGRHLAAAMELHAAYAKGVMVGLGAE